MSVTTSKCVSPTLSSSHQSDRCVSPSEEHDPLKVAHAATTAPTTQRLMVNTLAVSRSVAIGR